MFFSRYISQDEFSASEFNFSNHVNNTHYRVAQNSVKLKFHENQFENRLVFINALGLDWALSDNSNNDRVRKVLENSIRYINRIIFRNPLLNLTLKLRQ